MKKKARDIDSARDVIMGDQYNILQVGPYEPSPAFEDLRAAYLDFLQGTYTVLDFKGIPQLETFSRQLKLEEVYVPLMARPELPSGGETWDRLVGGRLLDAEAIPEEALAVRGKAASVPVAIENALGEASRVVILGDPGSGKTTLLKYLALTLAKDPGGPLPILVPLNAYGYALQRQDCNLEHYVSQYFADQSHQMSELKPLFQDAIEQGKAVILLDGLDEIHQERAHLIHKVETFARDVTKSGNRVAVTSRIVGYREASLKTTEWSLFTLVDFDIAAIEQFTEKWCEAFERSVLGDTPAAKKAAEREMAGLLDAVRSNPGVMRLASNPLLLTILALIKRQGVTLPSRRVRLYEIYLETLISSWSKARTLDKRGVGPEMDYLETVSVLGPLALRIRKESSTAGLVPRESMIDWLREHYQGEEWGLSRGEALKKAGEFLASVHKYSNILIERGQGRYGFIHLTFEEALAARGLVQLGQLDLKESLKHICDHLTDPAWRETILLAVGIWGLVREEPLKAGQVVRAMLRARCGGDDAGKNVLVAGACLEDVGAQGLGRKAATEVTEALLAASRNRRLPPTVQRDAGFLLGRTGWVPGDLERFISVPVGTFLFGERREKTRIEDAFAIGKYPVTNLQFRGFMEAGGYTNPEFWSKEGWAWRTGAYDTKAKEKLEKEWLAGRPPDKRLEPFFWHDSRWNNPLAPVVGVCWFEAEAYCKWLSTREGKEFRLPTQEEWERACRDTDGREFPWGNEFDRNRLNSAEFWAGKNDLDWKEWVEQKGYEFASTTVVGQFPEGRSDLGAADMCGNVWEWTASWYDENLTWRVVRGGSWLLYRGNARCADRFRLIPDLFGDDVGFRVVSPGFGF